MRIMIVMIVIIVIQKMKIVMMFINKVIKNY